MSGAQLDLYRGEEPRPVEIAESLERAGSRSLVYVGQSGAVVSPDQVRKGFGFAAVCVGITVAAGHWMFLGLFGPLGWAGSLVFGGLMFRTLLLPFRLQRVATLMMQERYEEADKIAQRLASKWLGNHITRREALHARAQIANLRGDLISAAALQAQVETLYRRQGKRSVQYKIHRYGRVLTLANLGEVGKARVIFAEAGDEPQGDYLKLLHWTCELMLCFCEGRHSLDDEEIHLRGRRGLEVVPGTPLLALSSWAFLQVGDRDMAEHLLSVVKERWEPKMSRAMPRLAPWVRQATAGVT